MLSNRPSLLTVIFFFFLFVLGANPIFSDYSLYPPDMPVKEPGIQHSLEGMRSTQMHYTNFMLYTINIDNPGQVEIGVYNSNVDGHIVTEPFYRWRAGPMNPSENPWDIALDAHSRGFLTIKLPFGVGYTRDGRLKRLETGQLVTRAGEFPIFGEQGEIFLPEGDLTITPSGVIFVNNDRIDKLRVAIFRNLSDMVTINGSMFYCNGVPDLDDNEENYRVMQYHLEQSNVLKALIGDITIANKTYEASARAAKVTYKTMNSAIQMGNP